MTTNAGDKTNTESIKGIGKVGRASSSCEHEVRDDGDCRVQLITREVVDDVKHFVEVLILITCAILVVIIQANTVTVDVARSVKVNGVLARAIFIVGLGEVVTSLSIGTTADDTSTIVDVSTCVIVICNRVSTTGTASIIVRCSRTVVVGTFVSTTRDFVLVTHLVSIGIVQASAIAIHVVNAIDVTCINAKRIVCVGERVIVVVTSSWVCAAFSLVFVANSVSIGIVQACP